jgi:hypothetical protein
VCCAGVLAALGYAFSPTVWLYSIQGEVFALNNLLVVSEIDTCFPRLDRVSRLSLFGLPTC